MIKGAVISECGTYRYQLWRIWDESLPRVLFIMHNPSTADANEDDPTIRRCINFAKSWGYGGIMVGNLFPYRATDPKELLSVVINKLSTPENTVYIEEMFHQCEMRIMAFGNAIFNNTSEKFESPWHYLKLTKSGNPCHPLYLKGDLKPQSF